MEEQTNEALWYVVHTYSGYENKVANVYLFPVGFAYIL